MLLCPKCKKEKIISDMITGIYFCKNCGYQGTVIIMMDQEQKSLNINSAFKKRNGNKKSN